MKRKIKLLKPDAWDKIPGTVKPPKWLVYIIAFLFWFVPPLFILWGIIWFLINLIFF